MPYTLRKTNGTTLAIIQDGSIDTTTDLVFVGKNYAGYGQTVNENFLKLLENFAGSRFPENPLTGQLWFDTANLKLKVYDGNRFKSFTVTEIDNKRPSDLRQGDQWFDPIDQKLYVYNGTDFVMIGPEKTAAALVSQITGVTVPGNDNNTYGVLQASIETGAGSVIAAFSKQSFEPATNSDYQLNQHFVDLKRGISLPGYTAVQGSFDRTVIGAVPDLSNQWTFFGAANSAWGMLEKDLTGSTANFYDAKEYIRRSVGDSLSLNGPLQTTSNEGVTLGLGKIVQLHVKSEWGNTTGNLTNLQGSKLNFNINTVAYGTVNHIALDYNSGTLLILPNNVMGTQTTGIPVDIGTDTQRFRSLYAKNLYAGKLSTSTTGIIEGVWNLSAGSSINGGSVNATRATTSTYAVNLQGDDDTNYYHAQTGTTALSIAQRDIIGRLWTSGISTTTTANLYGTWNLGTGAALQASSLYSPDSSSYVVPKQDNTNKSIVQRTDTGGINASSVVTVLLSAGSLATSDGKINGAWQLTNGSTLQATYSADIAERYAADKLYDCGTVLVIGGDKEVTTTEQRANTNVAGIVSTNPAFKLNGGAGDDDTHPYIALKGRVPCKVRGPVSKGNRLVTSGTPGHAEVFKDGDDAGAVLGIALSGTTLLYDVIEVMVK